MPEPVRIAVTPTRGVTAPTGPSSDELAAPIGTELEPGRRPLRQFLPTTYRVRHQMPPWRMLWLLPITVGLHTMVWPPMWAKLIVVLVAGGLTGWRVQVKMKDAAEDVRLYANVCVTALMLWLLWAVRCGLWGQPGKYSPLLFLVLWLPLSYLWWDRHRIRPTDEPHTVLGSSDPFIVLWDANVAPVNGWRITNGELIAAGTSYRLHLIRGESLEDAEQARRKVASWLGGISRNRLLFEAGDDEDEATIRMIVLDKDNPQHRTHQWTGPTLDKTTGLYKHGVYPDGDAFLRLFKVEDGLPHRGCNSLTTGTTGSGKSRGLAVRVAEYVKSGMFVVWYADGKGGASAPELEGHVDWYCDRLDETTRMLRAAWKVMKVRARIVKKLHQAAFRNGSKVIFLGSSAFRFLQIVLDEAQEFLKHLTLARLVKAILRMGNECAMGVDLATQVPLLNELGGESGDGGAQVIRAMAKSGGAAIYKADDTFSGTVMLSDDMTVDPQALPRVPGFCYVYGHTARSAPCKGLYIDKARLYDALNDDPVYALEEASARAAGDDYIDRHQRAADSDVAPEEIDLDDLDTELAILLGEALPGQDRPGSADQKLTIKSAIFEVVKGHDGPMRRNEFEAALAGMGVTASKSAIDQALSWWVDHGHLEKAGHGVYDLINREDREPQPVS